MDINGQLSPSQTIDALHKLNHAPVKKLGQNFLIDANIVRKSIELANVGPGDSVVEVGPGLGTLTGARQRLRGGVGQASVRAFERAF